MMMTCRTGEGKEQGKLRKFALSSRLTMMKKKMKIRPSLFTSGLPRRMTTPLRLCRLPIFIPIAIFIAACWTPCCVSAAFAAPDKHATLSLARSDNLLRGTMAFSSSSLLLSSSRTTTTLAAPRRHHRCPLLFFRDEKWGRKKDSQSSWLSLSSVSSNDDAEDAKRMQRQQQQQQQQVFTSTRTTATAKSGGRSTETSPARPDVPMIPERPKIVVLGATGKIGRLVVRQLLEAPQLDATIVAFCRDYDKACRVLYDDFMVLKSQQHTKTKGPRLQIVQGDLVPREELPGYNQLDNAQEEERDWWRRASSAAKFYGNTVKDYDNRHDNDNTGDDDNDTMDDVNEALEEAIRGCTAIISCIGAVRPTHPWHDLLARPFVRLLRRDVSGWCTDVRHPYYVHYASTRKVLRLAEREQARREALWKEEEEADLEEESNKETKLASSLAAKRLKKTATIPPRIRFVRISDLCVGQKPWNLIPILTNLFHSMVFRYQEMTELLLEDSTLLDTIVLRPGDLVDDERDAQTTTLQVQPVSPDDPFETMSPARVGRDDVAALAVTAALSLLWPNHQKNGPKPALHYTMACRWAADAEAMRPYPAQGSAQDGQTTAWESFRCALHKAWRVQQAKKQLNSDNGRSRLKPYGLFVALPIYSMLVWLGWRLVALQLPGLLRHIFLLRHILPWGRDSAAQYFSF